MQQFLLLSYEDVYFDTVNAVNPSALLYDVPFVGAMEWMALYNKQVTYAYADIATQTKIALNWSIGLSERERDRYVDFILNHDTLLINPPSTFMFYTFVAQYANKMIQRPLTSADISNLVKAYLYCNSLYLAKQSAELVAIKDVNTLLLKADITNAEFKLPKHFVVQLHKAIKFFTFCEQDTTYLSYVKMFCNSWEVSTWQEYIFNLFEIYSKAIPNLQIYPTNQFSARFISRFLFDAQEVIRESLWKGADTSVKYFRDHMLLQNTANSCVTLNEILLVDKIYQGLLFDISKVLEQQGVKDAKGRPVSFSTLKQNTGRSFSEKYLCYDLLHKIFDEKCDSQMTGDEMDAAKVSAPSDYYARIEDTLFLFECKDILLKEAIVGSTSLDTIKKAIFSGICYDGPDPKDPKKECREGFGQLLNSIDLLINNNSMDKLDNGWGQIKKIYPIVIVVSDKSYSALGVNGLICEEFEDIIKRKKYDFKDNDVKPPIVIDFESLLRMGRRLSEGGLSFKQLLDTYMSAAADWPHSSFLSYCQDFYLLRQSTQDTNKDTLFMMGDILANLSKTTES